MGKQAGNPRTYWIRLEMASGQKPDAAHTQALAVLHDAALAKGVARAEMIADGELIRLAAQSVNDAIASLNEKELGAVMSEEKQNKPSRDAQGLLNMAKEITCQRVDLLEELTRRLARNCDACCGEPGESLALIEEIQTLAQLIHDYANQQLLEQCTPKEEDKQ